MGVRDTIQRQSAKYAIDATPEARVRCVVFCRSMMYSRRHRCLRVHIFNRLSVEQEFDSRNCTSVGPKLVAKESKRVGRHDLKSTFHNIFAKTQATAMDIANRFNVVVEERLSIYNACKSIKLRAWDISFLACCVYSFLEDGVERCILSEKRLIPADRYTKWNGNNGYVHSLDHSLHRSAEGAFPEKALNAYGEELINANVGAADEAGGSYGKCLSGHIEVAEAVDYGTGAMDYNAGFAKIGVRRERRVEDTCLNPRPEDFLQAFSHFSHWSSDGKMLVCDLQGVMSAHPASQGICEGVFELTDPVIHYRSTSGRQRVYGNTDLGEKGMHKFFDTHNCNDVCRLLCLPPGCGSPTTRAQPEAARGGYGIFPKRRKF